MPLLFKALACRAGGFSGMPIYEYRCDGCGQQFEVIQKFSDSPLEVCEACQGHLTKLISQTSFQLKGTGWYVTDYARGSGTGPSQPREKKEESKTDAGKQETSTPASTPAKSETPAPSK
jgi:putative FmdB family regulatory protein